MLSHARVGSSCTAAGHVSAPCIADGYFQLSATQITGWINNCEEEHGAKKASSFLGYWQTGKPLLKHSWCFTACCPLCHSELRTNVFWILLVLAVACVVTGMPSPPSAAEVWVQVTAGAGWCKRRHGSLPSTYIPPTFFSYFSFLSTLNSRFSILNFSSPKPDYSVSLHHFLTPLFPTASSCPPVLDVSNQEYFQLPFGNGSHVTAQKSRYQNKKPSSWWTKKLKLCDGWVTVASQAGDGNKAQSQLGCVSMKWMFACVWVSVTLKSIDSFLRLFFCFEFVFWACSSGWLVSFPVNHCWCLSKYIVIRTSTLDKTQKLWTTLSCYQEESA